MNNEMRGDMGGPKSAFTRYVKQPEQLTHVINTRTRRKSAFSRIKRLFSINKEDVGIYKDTDK